MDFANFDLESYLIIFFVFAIAEATIRLLPWMDKDLKRAPRKQKSKQRKH